MTAPAARGTRPVAMLTHSYYEEDPRVRREAESLVAAGIPVDVFALRRPDDGPSDVVAGVRLRRLDVQRHQGAGLGTYLAEYLAFLVRALFAVTAAHRHRRYRAVHVHTLPDFLVAAALPLRLAGVPVVLDLHEAMPEFFRMRFGARLAGGGLVARAATRALLLTERLSIALATEVLTVNDALAERLVALGVPAAKITVLLNSPDLARFDPAAHAARPFASDGTVRLVYAGALTPTYELDVVVRALALLRADGRDARLDVYGRGDSETELRALASDVGIADAVRFHGRIPIEDVPAAIAGADIGLAPTRRSAFTDFSLSTKIFEYAAMGKPVVASRLPTVERYFANDELATYEPGDPASLASAVAHVAEDHTKREERIARARARGVDLGWDRQIARYLEVLARIAPG